MLRVLDRVAEAAAVAALVASTAMISANVFYRYVVLDWLRTAAASADWMVPVYDALNDVFGAISVTADEVPGYLLVWIAFLGAYLASRENGHIAFEALVRALPERAGRALALATDVAILVFLAVLLVQSVRMIRIDGATEIETAAIAQGWFMLVLPVSAILIGVALIARVLPFRR